MFNQDTKPPKYLKYNGATYKIDKVIDHRNMRASFLYSIEVITFTGEVLHFDSTEWETNVKLIY